MKKNWKSLIVLTLVIAFLTACSGGTAVTSGDSTTVETNEEEVQVTKTYKIGLAAKNLSDPFTAWQAQTIVDKASELYPEFDVTIVDCEGSTDKSISVVENFIAQEVDIILWQASDGTAEIDVVNQAFAAGIPVISLSNVIKDDNSYAIKSDPTTEGEIMGSYVASLLDSGEIEADANIFIMRAPDGSPTGNARTQGMMNSLFNVRDDVTLVEEKPANWDRAQAIALMEDWLTAYDDIDAVLCHNDAMALGAMEAIEAAGRIDEIKVFGIDGLPEAIYSISQGKMTGSVIQDAITQADEALLMCYQILVEETTPSERVVYVDGEMISLANDNVQKWIDIMIEADNWDY